MTTFKVSNAYISSIVNYSPVSLTVQSFDAVMAYQGTVNLSATGF